MEKNTIDLKTIDKKTTLKGYFEDIHQKADSLVERFLISYYLFGIAISFIYETYLVGVLIGSLVIGVYYLAKFLFPDRHLNKYIASSGFAVFMAQFIYQMHGMFEMHFFAFIGSAIVITYQKWKTIIPIALIIAVHHALFAWMQISGYEEIYFSQVDWDITTFCFHVGLAVVIFFICGLWSYQFEISSINSVQNIIKIEKISAATQANNILLQKSNDALDSFVYTVSHDLKSPVIDLKGMISLAKRQINDDNPKLTKIIGLMEGTSNKFEKTITDFLEMAKIEKQTDDALVEINCKQELDLVLADLEWSIQKENAQINIDIPDDLIITFPETGFKSATQNLINNALKYRSKDRDIIVNVQAREVNGDCILTIADNGLGIDLIRNKGKIFAMFKRFHNHVEGTGLGLFMVKKLIENQGGTISIESEVDKGTKFTLTILGKKKRLQFNRYALQARDK